MTRAYRPVPLDSISRSLVEAVVTAEDARFREHAGIDYVRGSEGPGLSGGQVRVELGPRSKELGWALRQANNRREATRGASTITQQLAKNLYLSPSRNPFRKIKEAVTAYRLERALGKDRILELYLNVAELGDGVWGVEAASHRYFRTSARRVSLTQAAALAATLPFPLGSNPGYRPVRMRRRQDLILRRMRASGWRSPRSRKSRFLNPGTASLDAGDRFAAGLTAGAGGDA